MKLEEFDSVRVVRSIRLGGQHLPRGTEADVVDVHPDKTAFVLESGAGADLLLTHIGLEQLAALEITGRGSQRIDPPQPAEPPGLRRPSSRRAAKTDLHGSVPPLKVPFQAATTKAR